MRKYLYLHIGYVTVKDLSYAVQKMDTLKKVMEINM